MNTFKTNKGITLVALIITIIVLLILAVVSIQAFTEGGIFTKAEDAVNKYEEKREEEEGTLGGYVAEIDKYLSKDRNYEGTVEGQKIIITLTADNQIIQTMGTQKFTLGTFSYIEVTADVLNEVNVEGISTNPTDYSRAISFKVEGQDIIGILSKDEETLYIGDMALTLVETTNNPSTDDPTKSNIEYYVIASGGIEIVYIIDYEDSIVKGYGGTTGSNLSKIAEDAEVTITENTAAFNITVDGTPVLIGTDAIKIVVGDQVLYIQNGIFYLDDGVITEGSSLTSSQILILDPNFDTSRLVD